MRSLGWLARVAAALLAASLVCASATADEVEPGASDDELGGFDDDLGGFDDDLGGFEDDPEPAGDDELGGFDEDPEVTDAPRGRNLLRGDFWALTGSVAVTTHVAPSRHRSAAGNTSYHGLTQLRTRLNLQLDVDLPNGWELRGAGFGFYDWAYLARGRGEFTSAVRDRYEWEIDSQDLWIRGSLLENLDFKIGRQVVNWGRSENLRVLDVLNPLDNRTPGIADLEDLRRVITMGRFDYYLGDWNLSVIAIPEMRSNQNPVPGSDFSPVPDDLGALLPTPVPPGFSVELVERTPDSFSNWEVGAALTGIFAGWDASLHFAWYFDDDATLVSTDPGAAEVVGNRIRVFSERRRLYLYGAGANYTWGSFLFKAEIAVVDDVLLTNEGGHTRLDVLGGIEYYGFTDTTIVIEALNRHIFDFPDMGSIGSNALEAQEDDTQVNFRISRSFFNERLDLTGLALLLVGDDEVGSVIRVDAAYEVGEALIATVGGIVYVENDLSPLSEWGDRGRLFFELKYSF